MESTWYAHTANIHFAVIPMKLGSKTLEYYASIGRNFLYLMDMPNLCRFTTTEYDLVV